jgi:hypothetical protein
MLYRHVTNLRIPLDAVDMEFLSVLPDYRIGEPIAPPPRKEQDEPYTEADLMIGGAVGIYTTKAALQHELARKKTGGWSEKTLGKPWRPFGCLKMVAPPGADLVAFLNTPPPDADPV